MPSLLSLRAARRSKPVPFSSKNGLPRFLAEPRNDRGRCKACCHCEPQGEAIQCRSRQRMDCRGSLRNLAMTEDDAKPAVIASRRRSNPVHTSPENGLPRFLTEPRNDSLDAVRTELPRFLRNLTMTSLTRSAHRIAAVPSEPRNDRRNATKKADPVRESAFKAFRNSSERTYEPFFMICLSIEFILPICTGGTGRCSPPKPFCPLRASVALRSARVACPIVAGAP